ATGPARVLVERSLEIDPEYHLAYRELGFLLGKCGAFAATEMLLQKSISICPRQLWAYLYLGDVYWRSRQLSQAESAFLNAVGESPEWSFPAHVLAQFYDRQNRPNRALEYHQLAVRLEPDEVETRQRWRAIT
ncbi:MAG: hypothetical protein ABI120_05475, partial [Gemmatimonadaceae bacterium]